jgi:hypothetical protein
MVVRTSDSLGDIYTDVTHLGGLLGLAVQYACSLATTGSIVLAAEAGARDTPAADCVMFTITCSGRSLESEAALFSAQPGTRGAACVGVRSVPHATRPFVEHALQRSAAADAVRESEQTYTLTNKYKYKYKIYL